jgi:hypothetical protein
LSRRVTNTHTCMEGQQYVLMCCPVLR